VGDGGMNNIRWQHRLEYQAVLLLDKLLSFFTLRGLIRFANGLAFITYRLIGIRKEVTRNNIRLAFPELSEKKIDQLAFNCYCHFAFSFLFGYWAAHQSDEQLAEVFEIDDPDAYEEMLNNRNGRILVSGHLGNWEVIAQTIGGKIPLATIYKRQSNPLTDAFFYRKRAQRGMHLIPMKEVREKGVKVIRDGFALGFLSDQDAGKKGIFVNFMGRPASTYAGAAVYAKKTRADIYFLASLGQNNNRKTRLFLEKLPTISAENEAAWISEQMQMIIARLEHYVRLYPEQYFWMHKRWKTQP
jgi:KDO2-lipid IV(A) lauroyltransferase